MSQLISDITIYVYRWEVRNLTKIYLSSFRKVPYDRKSIKDLHENERFDDVTLLLFLY